MTSSEEMRIDPARAKLLVSQLGEVQHRISAVSKGRAVRLVAVSKLKPANDILALHRDASVRHDHFGENYAQELRDKAAMLPKSIKWHFIGSLQTSNCKIIAKVPNLYCVSSVDTVKKVKLLNRIRGELRGDRSSSPDADAESSSPPPPLSSPEASAKDATEAVSSGQSDGGAIPPLNIHVQVNTSGEESKSGCSPGTETLQLCRLVEECPHLHLAGLMTIGALARSQATTAETENEDFKTLVEQRDFIAKELGFDGTKNGGGGEGDIGEKRELELSMGMSEDFEGAIRMGSGEVRVGSTIFGERPKKADAKIQV